MQQMLLRREPGCGSSGGDENARSNTSVNTNMAIYISTRCSKSSALLRIVMSAAYLESEPEAGSCLTPDIARTCVSTSQNVNVAFPQFILFICSVLKRNFLMF